MKEKHFVQAVVCGQCYGDQQLEQKLFCEHCLTAECLLNPLYGEESQPLRLVG